MAEKTAQEIEEVHHPSRYKAGDYECYKVAGAVIDANDMNGIEAINTFNIFKYGWRWKQKTPRASLLKIIESCRMQLDEIEAHPENYLEG